MPINGGNWGGKRVNAGRPCDEATSRARIGLELFQIACRQHNTKILDRFMQMVEQKEDHRLALDAGQVILAYGFGKPRETVVMEGEVITRQEYGSFDELKQVLIERGLPVDRLLEVTPLDLQAEDVSES
jgi:hypothetical protein